MGAWSTKAHAVTIDPSDLWRALAAYRGYTYDTGPRQIVCSVLTAELCMALLGRPAKRGDAAWRAMQIQDPTRPWSPVEAFPGHLHLPGHGPDRPTPGRLHLCQGWRGLHPDGSITTWSQGHQWLWLADASVGWAGVVAESSVTGPRVWDAGGIRTVEQAVTAAGELTRDLEPMDWAARAAKWTDGVAWVAL